MGRSSRCHDEVKRTGTLACGTRGKGCRSSRRKTSGRKNRGRAALQKITATENSKEPAGCRRYKRFHRDFLFRLASRQERILQPGGQLASRFGNTSKASGLKTRATFIFPAGNSVRCRESGDVLTTIDGLMTRLVAGAVVLKLAAGGHCCERVAAGAELLVQGIVIYFGG